MDTISISSDDSMPEPSQILAGPSKPRLMKTRPSSSQEPLPLSDLSVQDKDFIAFRFMNPLETTTRVQAAWNQAGRNQTRAARFLADPTWSPNLPASPSFTESGHIGRIKEVDDVLKAQRVANKEKGKRSMIYANRPVLDTKTPATPPSVKTCHRSICFCPCYSRFSIDSSHQGAFTEASQEVGYSFGLRVCLRRLGTTTRILRNFSDHKTHTNYEH